MAFVNPLDLQTILVSTLAGSTAIFTFLAVIVLMSAAAYFKMPNTLAITMLFLFGIMFAATIGYDVVFLIILVMGLLVFYILGKMWKQ